jgi:glucan phosphoethanolaminetransferase (alkaline phosphatase superfamily)
MPTIVTRKPATETGMGRSEASIRRAMQETGFDTWWISNQFPIGKYDSPVATYALEANNAEFLNHGSIDTAGSYDEILSKPLQDALEMSPRDFFIILHMMGGHLYYDMRYPRAFKIFRPTFDDNDSNVLPRVSFGNSYDNTIVYTDNVLAQIIGILQKSQSVSALYYVSDHGETLPTATCSKYGHGNGSRNDFKVPAIFWYSDAYAKNFPEKISALRANANQQTLSDDTFESLIDMAGIDFPTHDSSRSLFSSKWKYQPRIVNPIWEVDYDKAVFSKSCDIVLPPGANTDN